MLAAGGVAAVGLGATFAFAGTKAVFVESLGNPAGALEYLREGWAIRDDVRMLEPGQRFELADTLEKVLGHPVERVVRTVTDLRRDLAARPDDAMSQYRLAFARGTGVAWDIGRTFNAAHGIQVTDVASWIRDNLT